MHAATHTHTERVKSKRKVMQPESSSLFVALKRSQLIFCTIPVIDKAFQFLDIFQSNFVNLFDLGLNLYAGEGMVPGDAL